MVSVTLSIPPEVKAKMDRFSEINWSGFIRKCLEEKAESLSGREELLKKLKEDEEISEWAVRLQRASRSGRFENLKRKGLI